MYMYAYMYFKVLILKSQWDCQHMFNTFAKWHLIVQCISFYCHCQFNKLIDCSLTSRMRISAIAMLLYL
jgi:hypothetical protein